MSTLVTRNFRYAVKHPVRTARMARIMRDWADRQPQICAFCGRPINRIDRQVHHVFPLWAKPEWSETHANFSLVHGGRCHLAAHLGSFAERFVANWHEICQKMQRTERPSAS